MSQNSRTAAPIAGEIIRNALKAAANQTRKTVIRTAFSGTIYDWQDFSSGLFDDRYRLLAQDDGPPGFIGALAPAIEAMVAQQPTGADGLRPGDVLLSTSAYHIGSHAQDLTVALPVFHGDVLVGFVAIKGHVTDIGQKDAMLGTDTTDIWQEGTIYPGVKIHAAGQRNEDLWRTILANSRTPATLEGDIDAFLGGGRLGIAALRRVIDRYGLAGFRDAVERMFDYSERLLRARIAAIPNGRYRTEAIAEAFDPLDPPRFEITVEIAGTDIIVDFTNAPPQRPLPFNAPRDATVGFTRAYVLSVIGGADSINDGFLRPIKVLTKPGSFLHAESPAPVSLYFYGTAAATSVFYALSEAMPRAVPGGVGAGATVLFAFGRNDEGELWGAGFNLTAGRGGLPTEDGSSPLMQVGAGSMKAMSCEVFEARTAMVIERFELAASSGGTGTFRGSPGLDVTFRTRKPLMITLLMNGVKVPIGRGVQGGAHGRINTAVVHYPDGAEKAITRVSALPLPAGTKIAARTSGGGGFGPASGRDRASILRDIADGYTSEDADRAAYPHAFEPGVRN